MMKMIDEHHLVFVFNSIHRVMLAELRLQDNYQITLMPVPRAISADCGMVMRIDAADCNGVVEVLEQENLQPYTIYRYIADKFEIVD